jgi:hypothetical protein
MSAGNSSGAYCSEGGICTPITPSSPCKAAVLPVAAGVANSFKNAADGYTPAESILGNILRTGTVYGVAHSLER